MFVRLNPHTFIDNVAVSVASGWYPVDWKWGGVQQRSISGRKHENDTVILELLTIVGDVSVIATATTWGVSGATAFSAVVQGPFQMIRVRKIGTNGGATVVGMV